MIWVVATFKAERNISVDTAIVTPFLLDAEYKVKGYITDAAYADADLGALATDVVAYRAIRKAIADLTLVYLRENNLIPPVAESYEESYSGVVSYKLSSGSNTEIVRGMTKAGILSSLAQWARTPDFTPCTATTSGRFVSTSLVITEEDDDD